MIWGVRIYRVKFRGEPLLFFFLRGASKSHLSFFRARCFDVHAEFWQGTRLS